MTEAQIRLHQQQVQKILDDFYNDLCSGVRVDEMTSTRSRVFHFTLALSQAGKVPRCLTCLYEQCHKDVARLDPAFTGQCPVAVLPAPTSHTGEVCVFSPKKETP